jgi:hypothetical protein
MHLWEETMAQLIERQSKGFFRWFDSGDLQSEKMLESICLVAEITPTVKHWLSTREAGIVKAYMNIAHLPSNLTIRISADMIGQVPNVSSWNPITYSMVRAKSEDVSDLAFHCPAKTQGGECGECRACWDPEVAIVAYEEH